MSGLRPLLEKNRAWSEGLRARDPRYFERLAPGQAPPYFWVGCSDSRVAAAWLLDLGPGEVFVHRNIANQARPEDTGFQAALQFAVESLGVRHVLVCGHTSCGGATAALKGGTAGALDEWLAPLRALAAEHRADLDALPEGARVDRLVELNVARQIGLICAAPSVRRAWEEGRPLAVHGLLYSLRDGVLRDLGLTREGASG